MNAQQNDADQLKKSIQDDIADSDSRLDAIRLWTYAAPQIQSRKTELQSLLDILNGLPQDVLDEIAPALLQIQRESRARFVFTFPTIYPPDQSKTIYYSSSGTASAYAASIISAADIHPRPEWASKALAKLKALAEERASRAELPTKLAAIDSDLPATFAAVLDSYDMSKTGIVGRDNAVMRMRDLIEHVWRGLTSTARLKCQAVKNHLELKKPSHREEVARCLADPANAMLLLHHINELQQLFMDLSKPGKEPAFNNAQLTDEFFTRLIFQIDSLFTWMTI